jgi:acyl-coenzyme A synthetase/AMP-(fatty) acid ligase
VVATSTSHIDTLFDRLAVDKRATVIFENGSEIDAGALLYRSHAWITELRRQGLSAGDVCAIVGDFGRESVSTMLALMRLGAIAMPLSVSTIQLERLLAIAGARWLIRCQTDASFLIEAVAGLPQNDLIVQFQAIRHPGLVVFTSGSSGEPKGILHDFERVLGKFSTARPGWRTILFLTIDHFGGINTLLGCLVHGGIGVCLPSRTPDAVCSAIETARAELLPTTPTFLKVLLASGCWKSYDLSSLQMITYGAEPMPQATLERLAAIFPRAKLKQTYGLSELGVLHSKSLDDKSLWLRVGGEGFETRIVDGVLQIRSQSNMIGYLNAPNPIDHNGWMSTGDLIEQQNGFIRFLGRVSDIINVGGQKVFPGEIEDVLLGADGVADATVFATPHPLLGQAVCARVSLLPHEPAEMAVNRLRQYCRERLAKFKVPMRFEIVDANVQSTDRNKKFRPATKKV